MPGWGPDGSWHYSALAWDDSLEPARAVEAWRRAVRIDPTHRLALSFLSQHFNWMHQFDSARVWADSRLRIDPTFLLARQQIALAQLYVRDTIRAAENFRASIRIGKGPDEVPGWIADSHFQLHLHRDAGLDPLRALPRFKAMLVRPTAACWRSE